MTDKEALKQWFIQKKYAATHEVRAFGDGAFAGRARRNANDLVYEDGFLVAMTKEEAREHGYTGKERVWRWKGYVPEMQTSLF